ncbi:hypothetical protein AB0D32_24405 [Micromonospora sp. NPDC048170]|uniref:hypothetical protein n=1 Tax=Micromonospora sp. NPDC048170 TaxID=3154819 RepID=UPI0033E833C8
MALAIVVEARAIASKWKPGEQRLIKSIQGAFWATPLTIYAFAIPNCFVALAGGKVSAYWTTVIPIAISVGVTSLVLNPALELLIRSNARIAAYIIYFSNRPKSNFKILKLRMRNRRLRKTLHKSHHHLDWSEVSLRSLRWKFDQLDAARLAEGRDVYAKLSNEIDGIAARRLKLLQTQAELEAESSEIEREYLEIREEHLQKLEAALAGTRQPASASSQTISVESMETKP